MIDLQDRLDEVLDLMPKLKNYSIVLLTYLVLVDPDGVGVELKLREIMKETGLCLRSIQLGVVELENLGVLIKTKDEKGKTITFTVTL